MTKTLKFSKMEGAGNDFVVIDNREYRLSMNEIIDLAPCLCNRRFGIGADGLLVLQENEDPDLDFTMIYRNADGSDAGMCGNGARCLCMYAHHHGFPSNLTFNVHDNIYTAEVRKSEVCIRFPVTVKTQELEINDRPLIKADAATEHLVCMVPESDLEKEDELVRTGRSIRNHELVLPEGSNVNFVSVTGRHSLKLQTYERGVEDLTLACGTGSLAASIAAHHDSQSDETDPVYEVQVKGGKLNAGFHFDADTRTYAKLTLTGPAHFVFKGSIQL
ncbi:diaminopimelate epimerase [Balneola sp. MJW-20]|uniref:diaminopimelate epimerase n=1 Tax=Gracilimonas aurantiaca TaxID=3234185 RepID=UPI0034651F49